MVWSAYIIILVLYKVIQGYIGIMEKRMETTIVYWGYMGLYRVATS